MLHLGAKNSAFGRIYDLIKRSLPTRINLLYNTLNGRCKSSHTETSIGLKSMQMLAECKNKVKKIVVKQTRLHT